MFLVLLTSALFSGAALAEEHVVTIRDYRFVPDTLRIRAGDTVRWINLEKRSNHSILLAAPLSVESERLFPGEIWSRQFATPGQYAYRCGPHPEMSGQIEVVD